MSVQHSSDNWSVLFYPRDTKDCCSFIDLINNASLPVAWWSCLVLIVPVATEPHASVSDGPWLMPD